MKRLFKIALLLVMIGFCSNAFAWSLSWESVSSWGKEKVEPVTYNVEASGNNLRVYEWVTPTKPYQKCVFVASEHNTQLDCDLVDEDQLEMKEDK